ncbi:MAG: hypothetical protein ACYS7Y_28790 [Planctomycetota bacterium]
MSASQLQIRQGAKAALVRAGQPVLADPCGDLRSGLTNLRGSFVVEHWRAGKRINEYHFDNGIVNEGKNKLLDVMFDGATQITTWYLGCIDNSGYTALADADTYDNIDQAGNGWDEFKNYTDGNNADNTTTRPVWPADPASAQSITNSTVAVYNITGSGTVKGIFAVGGGSAPQTKGDHASGSTLWATALFTSGDVAVQNSDQLKVTYTVSA